MYNWAKCGKMIQKYINLYFNKSITKCVADVIQISRLFLGENNKARSCLLAGAMQSW